MARLPAYEKALREYEALIESVPDGMFTIGCQGVIETLRRTRPKTTMLSLHLLRLAYGQLLQNKNRSCQMLLLAALAVSCPKTQMSLAKWARNEVLGSGPSLLSPDQPPQFPGIPPKIMDALSEAMSKINMDAIGEGSTVVNTAAGPVEVFKMKNIFGSLCGDPRLN